jgi:glycosyltransferase involved in cell wall biosynthesis
VLCVSEAQRRKLAAVGCRPARLQVLPIGIRRGEVQPAPAPVPGRLRLCNWAGLDPRKGLHVLLAALQGSEQRERFELHLHGRAGEAWYMQELQRLAKGLDVHWHGAFADGAFWQFAGRCDLAVFPSLAFETHGLMVDEALLAGLPVLCSDLGAPPARLGGRGAVFPPGNAAALRSLLERLLAAPDEVQRMRSAPHAATDLETHHARLLQLYCQLCGHMPGAPDCR